MLSLLSLIKICDTADGKMESIKADTDMTQPNSLLAVLLDIEDASYLVPNKYECKRFLKKFSTLIL